MKDIQITFRINPENYTQLKQQIKNKGDISDWINKGLTYCIEKPQKDQSPSPISILKNWLFMKTIELTFSITPANDKLLMNYLKENNDLATLLNETLEYCFKNS